MGSLRGQTRVMGLLSSGCPQCEQKEEFKIIKEKHKERTYTVFSRLANKFQTSTSDDEWQEHIIFCPTCEWKEDI